MPGASACPAGGHEQRGLIDVDLSVEEQVMALNVRVTQDRPYSTTVHLHGRLDSDSVAILDDELTKLAGSTVSIVVFDLAELDYISSAGLRSIFAMRQTLAARSGRIVLLNARPPVQKVFDIVRAADVAAVFKSVEELDRYLDAMQRKVAEEQ